MDDPKPCIAVMPFALAEDDPRPLVADLCRGFACLIDGRLRMIPGTQVFVQHLLYTPKSRPDKRGFLVRRSLWPLEEVLNLPRPDGMEPTHVVQGTLKLRDRIEVVLEVIDVRAAYVCCHHRIEAGPNDFLDQFFPILGVVARAIGVELDKPTLETITRRSTSSFRALLAYLQGLAYLTAHQLPVATHHPERSFQPFLDALEADAGFMESCLAIDLMAQEYFRDNSKPREPALAALREACDRAPNYTPLRGTLGQYLFEAGRYDEARTCLEDYIRHGTLADPAQLPSALVRLAAIYHTDGDLGRALNLLQDAVERFPGNPDILESMGVCHADAGQNREAERCWRRVLEDHPSRSTSLTNLGLVLWQRGELSKAEVLLTRAVEGPD
ncbi:tetratricopeptide repeat protein, partial [Candidatus Poribacteria bacterium]|nr:tetratricopeptide repeat protein [Candidatus Poribacteria bacterium]